MSGTSTSTTQTAVKIIIKAVTSLQSKLIFFSLMRTNAREVISHQTVPSCGLQ